MRYFSANEDRLVLRGSLRDELVRGAFWVFVAPAGMAFVGWSVFALAGAAGTAPLALTAAGLSLGCAASGLFGLYKMASASRHAASERAHIDLGERVITLAGETPRVFRTPTEVRVVRRRLLGWELRLEGDERLTLLRRVPHGSGRALARAADALAEALGVPSRVPTSARRAVGVVPDDPRTWAGLCYVPLDGVNIAYCLLALVSADEPRLRFAARQSLLLAPLEIALAVLVTGCAGVPLAAVSAPLELGLAGVFCPLALLGLIRLTVRLVATFRARRGEVWVMPWLAPIARRWAPVRPRGAADSER
ncbi:MAG TPA: hypothetical protein ENK57_13325 [Polyangiaceae bacterium]|nr:hypothetical protein [Polyangiaceae bacterium]